MEIRTYRAATMHEALALVRRDLGPDAAVLHAREVPAGKLLGRLWGSRQIEVTASLGVNVPSRFAARRNPPEPAATAAVKPAAAPIPCTPPRAPVEPPPSPVLSEEVKGQLSSLQTMVQELCRQTRRGSKRDLPDTLFRLFTDLIEADLSER